MRNIGKLHHVGYMVTDIQKAVSSFQALGRKIRETGIVFDAERQAEICFLDGEGGTIELVKPRENSDLFPLTRKFKNSPYHVCFEVPDIDNAIMELRNRGFLLFKAKSKAVAISDSAQVAFLMSSGAGMVELVQMG